MQEGSKRIELFPFVHVLEATGLQPSPRPTPKDFAAALISAYKSARLALALEDGKETSFAMAFTATWLLLVPLLPPDASSARHEAWLAMPPPPPCSLCGVVLCPTVQSEYPETMGEASAVQRLLISNRAIEEGIPESAGEAFNVAEREVRLASRLLESPVELLAEWAIPL